MNRNPFVNERLGLSQGSLPANSSLRNFPIVDFACLLRELMANIFGVGHHMAT